MPRLLLVGAEVDERGRQDAEGGHVEGEGHVVGSRLLGERPLVLDRQAEPAVLGGEADAREAAVPEGALQAAFDVPASRVGALADAVALGRHVVGQPGAGPGAELVDALVRRGCGGAVGQFLRAHDATASCVAAIRSR